MSGFNVTFETTNIYGFNVTNIYDLFQTTDEAESLALLSNPSNSSDLSDYYNDATNYTTTDISQQFIRVVDGTTETYSIYTANSGVAQVKHGMSTGYKIDGVDLANNAIARYHIFNSDSTDIDISKYNHIYGVIYGGGGAGMSSRQGNKGHTGGGAGGSGGTQILASNIGTMYNVQYYNRMDVTVGTGGVQNTSGTDFAVDTIGTDGNDSIVKIYGHPVYGRDVYHVAEGGKKAFGFNKDGCGDGGNAYLIEEIGGIPFTWTNNDYNGVTGQKGKEGKYVNYGCVGGITQNVKDSQGAERFFQIKSAPGRTDGAINNTDATPSTGYGTGGDGCGGHNANHGYNHWVRGSSGQDGVAIVYFVVT